MSARPTGSPAPPIEDVELDLPDESLPVVAPLPQTAVAPAGRHALPARAAWRRPFRGRPLGGLSLRTEPRRPPPLRLLSFCVLVALPVLVAGVYYVLIAADQYVVEFRFGLRSAEPAASGLSGLFASGLTRSPIGMDSHAVVQYIGSRTIIDDLDKKIDIRAIFSRPEADRLARLPAGVPIEAVVRYWRGQVDAFYDNTDGTVTVTVRAFRRQDAFRLAKAVLAASEHLVNALSARARRDALRHARSEVQQAEARLERALAAVRAFRDKQGIIDPRRSADAAAALAGQVRDELVHADAELATLRHYMHGDAPSLKLLEARIRSLRAQRRAVESEVTSTTKTHATALSRMMGAYDQLEAERLFAEKAYQHALEALDQARMNADRQQVYLATFVEPSLPQQALYPHRARSLGVVFLVAFAVWAIGSLLIHSVRDHL